MKKISLSLERETKLKITQLSSQVRNPDRVNVFIDGKYSFSLDISQVTGLGVKVGREIDEIELEELKNESQFGKLYARSLEYCLMRPRSVREMSDYLWRKTRDRIGKEGRVIKGYSPSLTSRVIEKLQQRGYLDDEKFTVWWVENRHQTKGISKRKLSSELHAKGISSDIVNRVIKESDRDEGEELKKIIAKKQSKYSDPQKLIAYLARQGFSYEDIKSALATED